MMHARHDLSVARPHKLKHVSEADNWWTKMNVHGRSLVPPVGLEPTLLAKLDFEWAETMLSI